MRKIYRNETDHFSAESAEEANRMQMESYGMGADEIDEFEEPPVPDEHPLSVQFEGGDEIPEWAKSEPEATIDGLMVSAPARVWAKHETGLVCSTEY